MGKQQFIVRLLFCLYILGLFYITLFAWNYGASLGAEGPGGRNYNVIPFRSIYRIAVFSPTIWDPIRILLGNVILFLPLGFLLPIVWKKARRIQFIIILGFVVSLLIETSQFLFTYRVANIDDVILNTLGTLIGALVFHLLLWIKRRAIFMIM